MTINVDRLAAAFRATGRNWDQLCAAGVRQACAWSGGGGQAYPSANDARHASNIVSRDASTAPVGAVHWWSIGKYGHVAGGLGGSRVFMCSKHVDISWGHNVGETTVEAYGHATGAQYLGWSRSFGTDQLRVTIPHVRVKQPSAKARYVTVLRGEGLIAVAHRAGVAYSKVLALNPGVRPSALTVGQRIRVR